jgi:hypothetical protein
MAIEVDVFGKEGCAQCQAAKAKFAHFLQKESLNGKVQLVFHDMGTPNGLAEGALHDVIDIPTTIVLDDADESIVKRWDGCVPTTEEFARSLGQPQA